ncbi:MAG TPA: urate hydroxylase PuuD [Polyangiaceae bacterium]|nr:urate hydroxylase PuuD [Polyangiaceae bacterium]
MIHEWLHYALRLFHLIAGIMWIGTSFYFVWLDSSFEPLAEPKPGVEGETYMVHGGFFYRVEKQLPLAMPRALHWFKYEALLTWVSGAFLLGLVYWAGAGSPLVDSARFPLHPHVATTISALGPVAGWLIYDTLWKVVGPRAPRAALAASIALLLGAIAGFCTAFTGRAAYIHVGVLLGTVMVANVWMRILPNQRRMIAARLAGREPDWKQGVAAKQRSMHNSYMTLPVLATMVSNHFSFAFDHALNGVLLVALCVVGASARHLMITIEKKQTAWWAFAPAAGGLALLVALTMPKAAPPDTSPPVAFTEVNDIVARRCRSCHSGAPTDDVYKSPPNGVSFDSPDTFKAFAPRVRLRVVEAKTMPLANKTNMTDEERAILRRWIDQGARLP